MRPSNLISIKSNARRAARKAGCNPNSVRADRGGFVYDLDSRPTKAGEKAARKHAKVIKAKIGKGTKAVKAKPTKAPRAPKGEAKPGGGGLKATLDLIMRKGGALITEICAATGWLPHTARARISGLAKQHKKTHEFVRTRDAGVSRYTATTTRQAELPLAKE